MRCADRVGAATGVYGAQRFASARRLRHDRIPLGRIGIGEPAQRRTGNERQIAGEHQDRVVAGGAERRVQAAERTRAGDGVRNHARLAPGIAIGVVRDDADIVGERREGGQLTVEDAASVDDQGGLVGATEAAGATACQDRGGNARLHARQYHAVEHG